MPPEERECCRGLMAEWAAGTIAEWLPGYIHPPDEYWMGHAYRVVAMDDGTYEVRYSDVSGTVVGRYRIRLEVEEVNNDATGSSRPPESR